MLTQKLARRLRLLLVEQVVHLQHITCMCHTRCGLFSITVYSPAPSTDSRTTKQRNALDTQTWKFVGFYARQLYRQVLLRARISYGNSVRLSVCLSVTTRYGFKTRGDRDSWSSPYDSPESLVSYEVIWCHWVKRFSTNEGIKEGYPPLRNRYVTTIGSSSVKTVADRHRLAAHHNKHC